MIKLTLITFNYWMPCFEIYLHTHTVYTVIYTHTASISGVDSKSLWASVYIDKGDIQTRVF